MKTLKQLRPMIISMAIIVFASIFASWLFDKGYINHLWDVIISVAPMILLTAFFAYIAWEQNQKDKKNGL